MVRVSHGWFGWDFGGRTRWKDEFVVKTRQSLSVEADWTELGHFGVGLGPNGCVGEQGMT